MAKIKDIALVDGFDWHGERQAVLALREPSGRDVADLGEPRVLVRTVNGYYYVEQTETIRRYIERCSKHESGKDVVSVLSMVDYLLVKDCITDFFIQAELKITAARQTPSSSE